MTHSTNRIKLFSYAPIVTVLLFGFVVSCADSSLGTGAGLQLEPTSDGLFKDALYEFSPQDIVGPSAKRIISDSSASDGEAAALNRTGEGVRFELSTLQSGTYTLEVRARGGVYQGPPKMRLSLNGKRIGAGKPVTTNSYTNYSFGDLALKQGQVLELVFTNDKWDGSPDKDRNLYIDHLDVTPTDAPTPSAYKQNLAKIKNASVRNRNEDASKFRNTKMADIPIRELFGPRSEYATLGETASNGFDNVGVFRAACEFSHFSYDDPIVYPGQPEAAHLHMFFGNTDVNAYTTYDSLFNSGASTCNGKELNRTGYWAPAMFDAEGYVRIPKKIYIYYKGYGEGLEDQTIAPYPEGLAVVSNPQANKLDEDGLAFKCISSFGGDIQNQSATIPSCQGGIYADGGKAQLEMNIKFQQCWNGKDPTNYKDNLSVPLYSWFSGICPDSHPTLFPNLRVLIRYDLGEGEDTSDWYLSSDVDPETFQIREPSGGSFHADWWGGWNKEVNQTWIDKCTNVEGAGCGVGYLSDGGPDNKNPLPGDALKVRSAYQGPMKVRAETLFRELCTAKRGLNSATDAAYCRPGGSQNVVGGHKH